MSDLSPAPRPRVVRLTHELPHVVRGVLPYFAGLGRRFADPLLDLQFSRGETYFVNHPDLAREVLVTVPESFQRSRWLGELRHLVGNGLLFSEEAEWVEQRRRLRPAYLGSHRAVVEDVTRAEAAALAADWRRAPGATVDVQEDVKRALLRALVGTMLSPDVEVDDRQIIADLDAVLQYISVSRQFVRHNLRRVGLGNWGLDRVRAAHGRLDAFIADVVDGCRTGRYASGLLLATLLPAEAAGEVDAENLHDEIGTLLVAGFDTTAVLVAFALWHLSDRPDLCDALRAEADRDHQPVTEQVLRETLRLYPPAWAIHRTAIEPVKVGGYAVKKGRHVIVCPYALHRHPTFWPDPDRFAPERFADAPENDALLGFEYLPFSHGRHTCIGKRMALQQARILMAELVERFDLARAGRPPRLVPGVILKAAGGLPMRVTPRAPNA